VPADEPFLRELDGTVVAEQLGLGGVDSEALTTLQEIQFVARRRDRVVRYPTADEQLIMAARPAQSWSIARASEFCSSIWRCCQPRGAGASAPRSSRRWLRRRTDPESHYAPRHILRTRTPDGSTPARVSKNSMTTG